jgi:hypothetical protein
MVMVYSVWYNMVYSENLTISQCENAYYCFFIKSSESFGGKIYPIYYTKKSKIPLCQFSK